MFNSIFTDDFLHLLCLIMPISPKALFSCHLIDMKGDVTKDCLGGFVERYIPLFVSEVKHYSELYKEEMKSRLYKLDIAYDLEHPALPKA